jgi:uncharacterized protein YyaL (SSP411 family)
MREVAIVGDDRATLEAVVWSEYRPDLVLASSAVASDTPPLLAGRTPGTDSRAMAYVCRNFVCDLPVDTSEGLAAKLRAR